MKAFLLLIITCFLISFPSAQENRYLKVLTFNVWTGLETGGIFRMDEYEDESTRGKRFACTVNEIRKIDPDIIMLQEGNPVSSYSSGIADSLGYDEIHQVCNAGIKIGTVGLPVNFQQGNIILAKKKYNLKEKESVKLSGSFGLYGDVLSFHFDESSFALAGTIEVNGRKILVINTHLHSRPTAEGTRRRIEEIKILLDYISDNMDLPVVLAGDLNSVPESEEIRTLLAGGNLRDTYRSVNSEPLCTWDPGTNKNIDYSRFITSDDPEALLEAEYDGIARCIDYIFVNDSDDAISVSDSRIVLNEPVSGIFLSDHYGLLTTLEITHLTAFENKSLNSDWDVLPLAAYSSDYGMGYGIKLFLLNQFHSKESLDFTLFYSSLGTKWYRFVFSVPDFELRQRTLYSAAFDLVIDYTSNEDNFFGFGNKALFDELENYTSVPFEIKLQLSRGLTETSVLSGGLKYSSIRVTNYDASGKIAALGGINSSTSRHFSAFTNLRYDSRNSFINPSKGLLLSGEVEYVPEIKFNNAAYSSFTVAAQSYNKLFYPKTILALRILFNGRIGSSIPLQNLSFAGGGTNLRGYHMSRMVDKYASVFNAELRFPVYRRLGGIAGLDAANVWNKLSLISIADWKISYAAGLRFYFNTFVARLDLGFSKEATGFYLDFGHIF